MAKLSSLPLPDQALPGRAAPMPVPVQHFVNGAPLRPPFPGHVQEAVFGLGCFWGAERKFWQAPGVVSTAVGYAGGSTPNPTQGMRQGGDIGTQYRSAIYATTPEQKAAAEAALAAYDAKLRAAGFGPITTEVRDAPEFYYAEDYHQQYAEKNGKASCPIDRSNHIGG